MYPCQDKKFLNLSQGNNPNEGLHRHNRFNLIRLTLFNWFSMQFRYIKMKKYFENYELTNVH